MERPLTVDLGGTITCAEVAGGTHRQLLVRCFSPLAACVVHPLQMKLVLKMFKLNNDRNRFCICQVLFPGRDYSRNHITRNRKGRFGEDAICAFSSFHPHASSAFRLGTSFDKESGEEDGRQVKVIDQRGIAVIRTERV